MKASRNWIAGIFFFLLCLPAVLSRPIPQQKNPPTRKVGPKLDVTPGSAADTCAKPTHDLCVDVCTIGENTKTKTERPIQRWSREKKLIKLVEHDDITLVANRDQVVWMCGKPGHSFQITGIQPVTLSDANLVNPKAPESPFCIDFKTSPIGSSGHPVYSGTAKQSAIGQLYKYSFTYDGGLIDPHLGVTGGGGTAPKQGTGEGHGNTGCPPLPQPNPAKTPNPNN